MNCDHCNKEEATVFLTQIVEGKMQKMNFCEVCAQKKGVNDPAGFALTELLLGLGLTQDMAPVTELTCSVCGWKHSQFKKTGRLGCSACYDLFIEELLPMLRNMHPNLVHIGKMPCRFAQEQKKQESTKLLQEELRKAIAAEEYEKAAQIRDEMIALQKTLSSSASDEHSQIRGDQKVFPFEFHAAKTT